MDHVQCLYISLCEPCHHLIIFFHNFIVIKILGCDRTILRSNLLLGLLINTTVDRIKQALSKVCSSTEELDLFTCLCCRYTAAYRIIIAPYRTHNIVILVLYGTCCNRNMSCIFLECFRQVRGIQYC